jgi:ribosomal protein L20A (L18A)
MLTVIEPPSGRACPRCHRLDCTDVRHRDVDEITVDRVFDAVVKTLASKK